MKPLHIILPVAALLLSATAITPAFAADYESTTTTSTGSTYNSVETSSGSAYDWNPFADNQSVYLALEAGGNFPTDSDFEDSGSYAAALGYQFGPMIRAELEVAYRNNDIEDTSGDADTWTTMLNAFWDFKNETRFTPYVGAGLGWAHQNLDTGAVDDDDNAFVYQVGAGASYNFTQNWAVTADYRWVDTGDFDYGAGSDDDYSAHEVRAGVRYTF